MTAIFKDDLAYSHTEADKEYWLKIYRKAFPTLESIEDNREDGPTQRGGIDKTVILKNGKRIGIDEKIRRIANTGDIMLEYQSSPGSPGWAEKPLLCDYIVYIFLPSGLAHYLPVIQLQSVWQKNKEVWLNKYSTRSAKNEGYSTLNCPVPTNILYQAIQSEFTIQFGESKQEATPTVITAKTISRFTAALLKIKQMRNN